MLGLGQVPSLLQTHVNSKCTVCVAFISFLRRSDIFTKVSKNEIDFFNFARSSKSLDYPVNVGRNIARESANSHFIFPSDIELYPSPGLIPDFLDMIRYNNIEVYTFYVFHFNHNETTCSRRNEGYLERKNPRVFVNSIFEIKENTALPKTKAELIELLNNKTVIPFHKKVCSECHSIPKSKEWAESSTQGNLKGH